MMQFFDPEPLRAPTKRELFRIAKERTIELGGEDPRRAGGGSFSELAMEREAEAHGNRTPLEG